MITAILSLLLLAGVFGSGMDDDDDAAAMPAENDGTGQPEIDFDGMP